MKTYIAVDIEANGPIPGDYSMTSIGAVVLDDKLDKTFSVNIRPISNKFDADKLKFVDSAKAVDAKAAMTAFKAWIFENSNGKPVFISDNNGFDWMFVCWYFWHFLNENPFGYNSQNINSLYKGLKKDLSVNIKGLRSNELSHIAVEDAIQNAKALRDILKELSD